ncbi:NAD(P)-binding protein [Massarina eburnea CBS 473.64]|uniref:NAD(P)-binding protein n=1 Tax=Massarina eburnea CBS 473.64 TaxID=1395130 RepID=A0A6A6RU55_9PLEO|nr:NAD(P)-binding protein [Massarina eburnea CBS 473.64]
MATECKKYALITGCTPGGIGHFLAIEFASKGFHVLATVRDPTKYTTPSENITYVPLELTSTDSIKALRATVSQITGGKLDILYNNAGRNYTVAALDIKDHEVRQVFETNVFAVMKMCRTFVPLLIETKGTIVQTGSLAGLMPYVFGSGYNASKAALHAYSDTLRVELAPLGVRVLNIVTGGVKSNLARVERKLPEDSYYQPLKADYERRLKHAQTLGMDTHTYAKDCVAEVLGREGWFVKKRWAWEGRKSWVMWFMWNLFPRLGLGPGLDWYFSRLFCLEKLKGTVGPDKKRV